MVGWFGVWDGCSGYARFMERCYKDTATSVELDKGDLLFN